MQAKAPEGRVMTDGTMNDFIEQIGRAELYEELDSMTQQNAWYPRYLKAVRVTLITVGYDFNWVETRLREALEARYLPMYSDLVPDMYKTL